MQRKALTVLAFALVASAGWLLVQDWQVQQDGDFVVIGRIEHRDRSITVKLGPNGTVYSVALKDGRTLYENIPADQLARRAPEIHDFIESATAAYAGMDVVHDALGIRRDVNGPLRGFGDATK